MESFEIQKKFEGGIRAASPDCIGANVEYPVWILFIIFRDYNPNRHGPWNMRLNRAARDKEGRDSQHAITNARWYYLSQR